MRAYISANYHSFSDRKFLERFCDAVESLGIETFFLPRDEEKWFEKKLKHEELMEKIKEEIQNCDIFILEISQGEVNLGAEIGQAFFIGKPIIIVTSKIQISPTLQRMADYTVNYISIEDLKNKLKPILGKAKELEKRKIKIDF